ncbi:MAG: hypothetical protein M3P42_09705 [Actinomycetota bacterium]|nr:hypothetical protein [Actinomycetota bacterium]
MRKVIGLVAVLTLGALPAIAFAEEAPAQKSAAQLCQEQKRAMGDAAFKALYGTNANKSNAFGKCVSKQNARSAENSQNAAKACVEERKTLGEQAFRDKYGKNGNKANAFGKCVSAKAAAEASAEQAATIKAAKACNAERKAMGDAAFKTKYGTGASKANAFGKCVSKHARA